MYEEKDKYIIAHDMGTSCDKSILMTVHGEIIGMAKQEYVMSHPQPGFAEQDPLDWWQAVCNTTRSVLKTTGIPAEKIAGITFSSLMQCLVPVDRDGQAVHPAITWLDGRAAEIMRKEFWTAPKVQGYNVFKLLRFLKLTGGTPGQAGKDQIGRILWLKKHKPEVMEQLYKFIDAKDFIIHKLTGKFITSVDLAVIWWLLDTRNNRNEWHEGLCRMAGVTTDQLAEVRQSAEIVGELTPGAAEQTGLLAGTPVINGAGDMSAAAVGSGAIAEGEMHISVGTSGWVGGHFTRRKIDIPHYAGCIGSAVPDKFYLAMAHQETAGACLEWLKNKVIYHQDQLIADAKTEDVYQVMDKLAEESGPGAHGVMFTPWMYGERCPLDDDNVRAGVYNLGLNHGRADLIRAVMEGVAFNTRWAMETLEKLYAPVTELNIIGGGGKSAIWCQIMADILNRNINQVADPQNAGARGMALLASMTLGHINSFEDIRNYISIKKTFIPDAGHRHLYDRLFREYKNIYKQNKKWYARMNRKQAGAQ